MGRHSLYPGFIRIHYTSNGHAHKMNLPVIPGLSGGIWTVTKVLGGTYSPWTAAVDALVILLKPNFASADSLDSAELFTLATPTSAPIFVSGYNIGVAGTGTGTTLAFGQTVFTWRTDAGGVLRMYLMENLITDNYRKTVATAGSTLAAILSWAPSSAGFVFGRDEGVPLAPIFVTSKINDQLRKRYLLNA